MHSFPFWWEEVLNRIKELAAREASIRLTFVDSILQTPVLSPPNDPSFSRYTIANPYTPRLNIKHSKEVPTSKQAATSDKKTKNFEILQKFGTRSWKSIEIHLEDQGKEEQGNSNKVTWPVIVCGRCYKKCDHRDVLIFFPEIYKI